MTVYLVSGALGLDGYNMRVESGRGGEGGGAGR